MSSSGKGKGKAVADKDAFGGKRKRDEDDDKTGKKGKNRAVLQFFDDEAGDVGGYDSSDDSIFGNGNLDDTFGSDTETKAEPQKAQFIPFLPKEEEMSEEELDKMLEERYRSGSGALRYAEDSNNVQRSAHIDFTFPSSKDPVIWKLKCAVGRERHSVFCLMQKYVELRALGTKLQIISAISLDHVKGFIFVEAEKQADVNEACKGLCSVFLSRTTKIAANEMSQLLSTRNKVNVVSKGAWARVKSGTYKGDLAQVVGVNESRKKTTVKLIPRIDLQNLALKFGGGGAPKKTTIPPPRLIGLAELEEFRPLIQFRRDRDTDLTFQVIDGLMLKDGYIYKKVPLDSLNFSGVNPSEDEILKFDSSEKSESNDLEWLSQLYGGRDRKRPVKSLKKSDKGGAKGEGSSSSVSLPNGYEIHDLVCFGRKDFGIILGFEKDNCQILKDAPEGPVVVTVDPNQLTTALSDTKFTALDHKKKTLSPGDTVKVVEGPSEGRQGIVKHIYRGIIFLTDDNEVNDGYFCAKSFMCEKVKLVDDTFQPDEEAASGFTDFPSSPKSHMPRERSRDFGREDKDGMFSVGQTLRIRVGPLKGYLCRVLAIRYSDITVKLNSQTKIFTVKPEHLSEVRNISTIAASDNLDSKSDAIGNLDSCGDWMSGAGTSTESNGWNVGAATERSGWPSFPAAEAATSEQSRENNSTWDNHPKSDAGGCGSGTDATQNPSWGGWGQKKPEDDEASGVAWGQVAAPLKDAAGWENKKATDQSSECGGWGQKKPENNESGTAEALGSTLVKDAGPSSDTHKDVGGWGSGTDATQNSSRGGWGQKKPEDGEGSGSAWGQVAATLKDAAGWENKKTTNQSSEWGGWSQKKPENNESGKAEPLGSSWGKDAGPSSDTKKDADAAGWESKNTSNKSLEWGGWGQKKPVNNESSEAEALGSTWGKDAGPSSDTQKDAVGWEKKQTTNQSLELGGWGQKKPENSERRDAEASGSTWGKDAGPSSGDTHKDAAGWENNKTANQSSEWGFWGQKRPENNESREAEAFGSTWGKDAEPSNDTQKGAASGWGTQKSSGQNASSWGGDGSTEQTDSWNKPKVSSSGEGACWKRQGADSSWGKPCGESSWHKSGLQQDGQDTESFDRESGGRWGRGRGRDQRGGRFSGGDSSEWSKNGDKFSGNSSSWKSDTGGSWGQSSTFGGRSNTSWNPKDDSLNSESGGRSGFDRGSFRGRGRSESGGFRGRGGFDRGGSRGGFGRRGGFCGRDRGSDGNGGGWKDIDFFEQKSWNNVQGGGWSNENNLGNKAGWSKEEDSQTGGRSKWKSWSSGGGIDEVGSAGGSQPSGWSQGGSWNAAS